MTVPCTSFRSPSRLETGLGYCHSQNRTALVACLPVGYPDPITSLDDLHLLDQYADVIELGLPCADAYKHGPLIEQAATTGLSGGFRAQHLFAASTAAVIVRPCWHSIHACGLRPFRREGYRCRHRWRVCARSAAGRRRSLARRGQPAGLYTIPLISARRHRPSGTNHDPCLRDALRHRRSHQPRLVDQPATAANDRAVARAQRHPPIATGIGISTPYRAQEAAAWADAVVIGSAVISRVAADPAHALAAFVGREFAAALARPLSHGA